MTEKRYDIEYDGNCYKCIVDCEKKVLYTDRKKIVKLLNEQNETIRRLEGENNQLEMSLAEIMEIVLQNDVYRDLMKEAIKELSEEGLEIEEMI